MALKNKRYNPQDDVFQLIDGKRVPVQAYDLRAAQPRPGENKSNTPTKAKGDGKEPDLSLEFNGRMLTLRVDDGKTITRHSVPAVSGRANKDGSFSYDKDRQKIPKVGPIPEGTHQVNLQDITYIKDTSLANRGVGIASSVAHQIIPSIPPRGLFPGDKPSWGVGRIAIQTSQEQLDKSGRDGGFFIHGGWTPGSAGCIDLVDKDQRFFDLVEKSRGQKTNVPLTVDYSKTPNSVFYKGRKKK